MHKMFIASAIWRNYAQTIALEDISESYEYVDEDVLTDETINTNPCSEPEYVCK